MGTAGDTRASGRSAPFGRPRVAKRVNRLRNQADPHLPGGHAGATGRHRLDYHFAIGGEHRRLFHQQAGHAVEIAETHRAGILRACQRRREAQGAIRARSNPASTFQRIRASWPDAVKIFSGGLEGERFVRAGQEGNRLDYLVRHGNEIWVVLGEPGRCRDGPADDARFAMRVARWRRRMRAICAAASRRTYVLLAAGIWLVVAGAAGLPGAPHQPADSAVDRRAFGRLAGGDLNARVAARRDDEIGRAIEAFNHMAAQLQESTRAPGLPDASWPAGRRWRARWRTR